MPNSFHPHPASWRDPSGFIFEKDGMIYRQINQSFKEHFNLFISSGCYEHLAKKELLISHEVINENLTGTEDHYLTLKPEKVPFISYPYEWSFDMLKDAALLTLQLVKESIQFGIIVKDATPYNIQWYKGKFIFIDSLSFEKYEDEPWIAYRQFCENFLGPLLLMHYTKISLQQLLLAYPDGIPLPVIRSLLPKRSRFSLHTYLHIHLHAGMAAKNKGKEQKIVKFSKQKLLQLITSLEGLVQKLKLPEQKTVWSDYYDEALQRKKYLEEKRNIIQEWLAQLPTISTAVDLGANNGEFSKLIASKNIQTLAADSDPSCINHLYQEIKTNRLLNIQPLILDLSNPSPAIGVNNEERDSFIHRCKVDLVLALALIHHLAIGKNIPFEKMAEFFSRLGKNLIVEFVPKDDEKIKLMLSSKKDIYTNYAEKYFEETFKKYFTIIARQAIGTSGRVLYLMSKHDN